MRGVLQRCEREERGRPEKAYPGPQGEVRPLRSCQVLYVQGVLTATVGLMTTPLAKTTTLRQTLRRIRRPCARPWQRYWPFSRSHPSQPHATDCSLTAPAAKIAVLNCKFAARQLGSPNRTRCWCWCWCWRRHRQQHSSAWEQMHDSFLPQLPQTSVPASPVDGITGRPIPMYIKQTSRLFWPFPAQRRVSGRRLLLRRVSC
jgi:hypothetical protein